MRINLRLVGSHFPIKIQLILLIVKEIIHSTKMCYIDLITVEGKVNGKPWSSSRLKFKIGSGGLGIPPCVKRQKHVRQDIHITKKRLRGTASTDQILQNQRASNSRVNVSNKNNCKSWWILKTFVKIFTWFEWINFLKVTNFNWLQGNITCKVQGNTA